MKYLAFTIPGPNGPVEVSPPPGVPTGGISDTGSNAIQLAINLIFSVAMILVIVFVIYSGIQWIMSGGDPKKIEGARNRLIYSIIGFIVIVGAFFIVKVVFTLLGVDSSAFISF